MAVVRITQTVKWEIDSQIKQQFATRRNPLIAQTRALLDGKDDTFRNVIASVIAEKAGVTEQQLIAVDVFLFKAEQLWVGALNGINVPAFASPLRFSKPVPVPRNTTSYTDLTSPRLGRWAVELKSLTDKLTTLDTEEKAFRGQIMRLLDGCSTYRQALEAWPQLKAVTPDHVWRRHEEVRERVKNEPVIPTLDIDQLNTTAVKNTIAGAMKEQTS